jgi:hypothetical protein
MPTCEDNVGLRLKTLLFDSNNVIILSYHPPDGKAYETDLIRIPKRGIRDTAVRDRYHVDLIFIVGNCLVLVELKCHLSESGDDIVKLREIRETYSLPELTRLISARLTTVPANVVNKIERLVLALGVETINANIPSEFAVYEAKESEITLHFGNGVSQEVAAILERTLV